VPVGNRAAAKDRPHLRRQDFGGDYRCNFNGEQKANMVLYKRVAVMRCKVLFTDSEGTEHAVEVEAETLYDAVGLAIARFHAAPPGMLCVTPRSRFVVEVRQPTTTHTVDYAAFAKWMNERFGPPRDLAIRAKLKELLKHRPVLSSGMG
jgi:hypothetical protein